jgi:hypothetical protein
VRAALAGGLVLGLGAGLTVASWTDAAYVGSPVIMASSFALQTKTGTAAYTDATTVAVAVSGVYPGSSGAVYLPILVRTKPGSVAGSVTFAHAASASSGLGAVLRYRVVRSANCAASAFTGSPLWVAGGASSFPFVTSAQPAVAGPALAADAGSEAAYCVEFTLDTGLAQASYQGAAAAVSFAFTGTSD